MMRQLMPWEKYTMKLLLSTLFVVGTVGLSPAAFAVDNSISKLCRAGAPAEYSRPGGYCEQVASNKSLTATGSKFCDPFANPGDTHYC